MANTDTLYFDKDCPLEAVVRLAEPRDIPTLNTTFSAILKEHIPDRTVRIYEMVTDFQTNTEGHIVNTQTLRPVIATRKNSHFEELNYNDEDVQRCLKQDCPISGVSPQRNKQRTIFPIPGVSSHFGFLVIEGQADASCHNFLDPLIRIYASHAFLLNRNEHDSLTGLYNRRALSNKFNQLFNHNTRRKRKNDKQQQPWCFALMDIDHFKQINDQYGHIHGDEVLILFSRLLERSFREDDLLFRYGGEEFVAILKDVDLNKANAILNRFRENVAKAVYGKVKSLTVSIGYTLLDTSQGLPILLDRADKALYYSKNNGRNQINCYEILVQQELVKAELVTSNIEFFPHQKTS